MYKYPHEEAAGADEQIKRQIFESDSTGWHRDIGMTEDMGHAGVFRGGVKICCEYRGARYSIPSRLGLP